MTEESKENLKSLIIKMNKGNLKTLSDADVALLATYEKDLNLRDLTSLSDAAAAFAKHKGNLGLDGLTSLSDAAAKELAKHEGGLSLGLPSLSDAAAKELANHKGGSLSLLGLTSLSDAARLACQTRGILEPSRQIGGKNQTNPEGVMRRQRLAPPGHFPLSGAFNGVWRWHGGEWN